LVNSPTAQSPGRCTQASTDIMKTEEILIEVYDKREKVTSSFYAFKLSDNVYRMAENDLFNCRLTFGTEFETRVNDSGKLEIVKIFQDSPFVTRRFMLNSQFKESEYRLLGDEIMKKGGFWQVDFGSIATINLPKDTDLNIDELFRNFNFNPTEIKD
jgi:hypothetical protein